MQDGQQQSQSQRQRQNDIFTNVYRCFDRRRGGRKVVERLVIYKIEREREGGREGEREE